MQQPFRRPKKSKFIRFGAVVVITILLFFCFYQTQSGKLKETYKKELQEMQEEKEYYVKEVYVTSKPIGTGELIDKINVSKQSIYTNLSLNSYITEKDFGKIALVDLDSGIPVLLSMTGINGITDDLREEEFYAFYLNTNLKEGDVIDLRILYPNGEDYIVLAKKRLNQVDLEKNQCFLWLDEEEILTISSAIVDCYLKEGSKLYTVKYIQPQIQPASIVNYQPVTEVIALMSRDPNIVKLAKRNLSRQIRQELDDRMEQFYLKHPDADYEVNIDRSSPVQGEEESEAEEEITYVD